MGLADLFKSKKVKPSPSEDEGLPNVSAEAADATPSPRSKAEEKEFRARETEAVAAAENEGLPSVNRRRGDNKVVTIIGFVVILGVATALLLSVNSEKGPKLRKKPNANEMIANNLPPLAAPPVPAPLGAPVTLDGISGGAAAAPAAGSARPIALQGGTAPTPGGAPGAAAKPVLDWTDRKMGGTLLVAQSGSGSMAPVSATATRVGPEQDSGMPSAFASGNRPGGSSPNDLSTRLDPTITRGVSASMLPDRNFLITKGTTLDCALETALDSTVPGITTCRLTRDVYSDNGQILLLDRGSQLVGEYQGGMRQGQIRLFVLWSRAKTPNGVVVALNSPGTDALGRSGLEGWVDNHFIERFGAAILMSFIKDSVTALANRGNGTGGTTNVYGSTTNGGERVVEKILESTVNIPPTLIKNQGDHIQVMVARDLDFSSVYALQIKE